MTFSPLMMICTCDLAGQVRGKAMPKARLEAMNHGGIGWTPTNSQITAFGPIAPSPWGAKGDTFLDADLSTLVELEIEPERHERFVLADITTLEREPWPCCPRFFLKRQIEELEALGLRLWGAFEHEFALLGAAERPNSSYALRSFREQGAFADHLFSVLDRAGLQIETFMPEYGPSQFELTVGPRPALRAADEAVILRELTRSVALAHERRASFTPLLRPDAVGNGVHLHFSLNDLDDKPVNYDAERPFNVSETAAAFLEGIRYYLPSILALTAAGTVSYLRLQPNRWSAAVNNIAAQDREAALRVCPVFDRQPETSLHFEYRASDATVSPYMALGALIAAGIAGLHRQTPFNVDAVGERLPQSLAEAISKLEHSPVMKQSMGRELHGLYLTHKKFECEQMRNLGADEQCARYSVAY